MNQEIRVIKPDKQFIEIINRVLEQNESILRMNEDLLKHISTPPMMIYKSRE